MIPVRSRREVVIIYPPLAVDGPAPDVKRETRPMTKQNFQNPRRCSCRISLAAFRNRIVRDIHEHRSSLCTRVCMPVSRIVLNRNRSSAFVISIWGAYGGLTLGCCSGLIWRVHLGAFLRTRFQRSAGCTWRTQLWKVVHLRIVFP